jgi:hypothetical protein
MIALAKNESRSSLTLLFALYVLGRDHSYADLASRFSTFNF